MTASARSGEASHGRWRPVALGAMLALACASSLVLVDPVGIGPAWVHWVASLVALAAGAGVLVIANLSWQRAVATAQAAGLVASNDIELSRSRRLSRSQG